MQKIIMSKINMNEIIMEKIKMIKNLWHAPPLLVAS
jgi:hypothetical protein